MFSNKSPFEKALIGSIVLHGIGAISLFSFLMVYGFYFFCILPFLVGLFFYDLENRLHSILGMFSGFVIVMAIIAIFNLEGYACLLMATPIFLFSGALGILTRWIYFKIIKKSDHENDNNLSAFAVPIVIFLATGLIEKYSLNGNFSVDTVETSVVVNALPEEAWQALFEFDTLSGETSGLIKLGLPTPYKASVDSMAVGATRICYFEPGNIVQEITRLEPGRLMEVKVIDYQLVGKNWIQFTKAVYTLHPVDSKRTEVTRSTSYSSQLSPRFYWRTLESLAIDAEHVYVLDSLKRKLEN